MNTDSGNLKTIELAKVTIGNRLRKLDFAKVQEIAKSVREVGLLTPITVTSELVLIAGHHRLEACRIVGHATIPAAVVDLGPLQRELAEIDENLIRNELTVLERGEHLARRKEIYETLHPETKADVRGGHAKAARSANDETPLAAFTEDAAAKTGTSRRSIEREVQIARDIAPDVKAEIRGTPLADQKEALLRLSRMNPEEQREAVKSPRPPKTAVTRKAGTGDIVIRRRKYNERLTVIRGLKDLCAVSVEMQKTGTIRRLTAEILEWFEGIGVGHE